MIGPEGYERIKLRKMLEGQLQAQTLPEIDVDTAHQEIMDRCRRDAARDDDRLTREEIEDRRERHYQRWLTR